MLSALKRTPGRNPRADSYPRGDRSLPALDLAGDWRFIWVTISAIAGIRRHDIISVRVVVGLLRSSNVLAYVGLVLMIIFGAMLYAWLYFAQFALVFDGKHSLHALLFSRDLMRKRFFKVATQDRGFSRVLVGIHVIGAARFWLVSLTVRTGRGGDGFLRRDDFFWSLWRDQRSTLQSLHSWSRPACDSTRICASRRRRSASIHRRKSRCSRRRRYRRPRCSQAARRESARIVT